MTHKSIAVLPFANMSDEKTASAFFSDGVHEDILTNLALIAELRVVSRTSVMQYRAATKPIKQIGTELGVAYLLEGSVRRVGNKVRVTSQLINARTDEHVWAKSYDRELTDIFAIQAALAQEIAGAEERPFPADAFSTSNSRKGTVQIIIFRNLVNSYYSEIIEILIDIFQFPENGKP